MIKFFESALRGHAKVCNVSRSNDILFHVERKGGDSIDVLLVNEYTLGLAAVLRACREFPGIQHIVTGGNWNAYTREAKEYGLRNMLGIFTIGEFLRSLNWDEPMKYYRKDKDGKPVYDYRAT